MLTNYKGLHIHKQKMKNVNIEALSKELGLKKLDKKRLAENLISGFYYGELLKVHHVARDPKLFNAFIAIDIMP